jgi:hypothetical protein
MKTTRKSDSQIMQILNQAHQCLSYAESTV